MATELVRACPWCGVRVQNTCHHDGQDIPATNMTADRADRLLRLSRESEDSRPATYEHIGQVRGLVLGVAMDLMDRAHRHDASKLVDPEVSVFDEVTPLLREMTYGSEEYHATLERMDKALAHHYAANDHHPDHFLHDRDCPATNPPGTADTTCVCKSGHPMGHGGDPVLDTPEGDAPNPVAAMDLIQLVEMLCDWIAATRRHADGDIRRSIEQNAERFGYGPELTRIFNNTVDRLLEGERG